jgi:hypothetical protein
MNILDELNANNKCETCKYGDICETLSYNLIDPDVDRILLNKGISVKVVIYDCKKYRRQNVNRNRGMALS